MSAFVKIFSMTDSSSEGTYSLVDVNHLLDLDLRVVNLVITGACLSSKVERVVL